MGEDQIVPSKLIPRDRLEYMPAKSQQPLVSVIIPTHNQEEHIERCLASVLNQSLQDLEVIVIDDASTDMTNNICQKWKKKDDRVQIYVNKKNMGQGFARNRALRLAEGKYISFVDSDDYLAPNFLLHAVYLLEQNHNVDIVHFSFLLVDEAGNTIKEERDKDGLFEGKEIFQLYCEEKLRANAVWSKLFRKDFLQNHEISFPHYLFEDNLFLLKAYFFAKHILFVDEIGYHYVRCPHVASAVNPIRSTHRHIDGILHLVAEMDSFYRQRLSLSDMKRFATQKYSGLLWRLQQHLPYVIFLAKLDVDPFTEINMEHLAASPDFLRLILDDYARLYATHSNYTPGLPAECYATYQQATPPDELVSFSLHSTMPKTIKLSIIIYTFNMATTVNRCLESVLEQYDSNSMEIILIDDCSTDQLNWTLCQFIVQHNQSIRLFRTPWNCGIGAARKLAIQQSKGDYITFVNGSDFVTPNFFRRGLALTDLHTDCQAFCFSYIDWDTVHQCEIRQCSMPDGVISQSEATAMLQYISFNFGASCKLFKRSFVLQFEHYHLNENYICILFMHARATHIRYSSIIMYYYGRNLSAVATPPHNFNTTIDSLKLTHSLLTDEFGLSEKSTEYKDHIALYNSGYRIKNILLYIYACNFYGLHTPLTEDTLSAFTLSKEFLSNLLIDYAKLLRTPLPTRTSHATEKLSKKEPLKQPPSHKENKTMHYRLYIPRIDAGSILERIARKLGLLLARITLKFGPSVADQLTIRRSGCFDETYYLKTYPDIASKGVDPIIHYVRFGAEEGRNPTSWFDTSYYCKHNPDVVAAKQNPFCHYLQFGFHEGRKTSRNDVTPN